MMNTFIDLFIQQMIMFFMNIILIGEHKYVDQRKEFLPFWKIYSTEKMGIMSKKKHGNNSYIRRRNHKARGIGVL